MLHRMSSRCAAGASLALAALCWSTGALQGQTARAYLSYDARGLDRRPVLRPCSTYRTPYLAAGALARQVQFAFVLDSTGQPQSVDSLHPRGQPLPSAVFQTAALELLRSCRFEPAYRAGQPVTIPVTVSVQFLPREGELSPELARRPIRGAVAID